MDFRHPVIGRRRISVCAPRLAENCLVTATAIATLPEESFDSRPGFRGVQGRARPSVSASQRGRRVSACETWVVKDTKSGGEGQIHSGTTHPIPRGTGSLIITAEPRGRSVPNSGRLWLPALWELALFPFSACANCFGLLGESLRPDDSAIWVSIRSGDQTQPEPGGWSVSPLASLAMRRWRCGGIRVGGPRSAV